MRIESEQENKKKTSKKHLKKKTKPILGTFIVLMSGTTKIELFSDFLRFQFELIRFGLFG